MASSSREEFDSKMGKRRKAELAAFADELSRQDEARAFARSVVGEELPDWLERRIRRFPYIQNDDGSRSTARVATYGGSGGKTILAPTIREVDGQLTQLDHGGAFEEARKRRDALEFDSREDADAFYDKLGSILEPDQDRR